MKARRDPLEVEITSGGKRIGALTAAEFMQSMNRPRAFLPALVTEFNARKEREGDPERAAVKLMRRGSKVQRKKNPEAEARELGLYANNLGPSQTGHAAQVYSMREKFGAVVKGAKPVGNAPFGKQTKQRLINLTKHAAHQAARAYSHEFGDGANAWQNIFTDADLNLAADYLYDSWLNEFSYTGNPTMARKKKRSAAQIAATKKLVAFNKKRRGGKTTKKTARSNPRKRQTALKKKATRSGPVGRDYQIFKCQGNSVHFLALTTDGHIRWTLTRGDTVRWANKEEAAKIARRLAKGRNLAGFGVGVVSRQSSALAIISACKPGK